MSPSATAWSSAALGLEGVVTALHDGTAEVDVRGKRMRAQRARSAGRRRPRRRSRRACSVNVELQPRDGSLTELNVIGCTVDEALTRAERFLDESLLTDQRDVRLIHGYGTGQLQRALAGFLQQHPLVANFAPRRPNRAAAASRWWS